MAFVHCHNCDWGQDDFWSAGKGGWLPFGTGSVEHLVDELKKSLEKPPKDRFIVMDKWIAEERYGVSGREVPILTYLAVELELKAKVIRGMHWMTEKDFENDPDKKCPKCGSKNLDID